MYLNVGERSDYLLLRRKIGALLELEIADCARQSKVAIHTTKINEATGSLNTSLLSLYMLAQVRAHA